MAGKNIINHLTIGKENKLDDVMIDTIGSIYIVRKWSTNKVNTFGYYSLA